MNVQLATVAAVWRTRMGDVAIKAVYHLRVATAESLNAPFRNRGIRALTVRGLDKAQACTLWQTLAHKLLRAAVQRVPADAQPREIRPVTNFPNISAVLQH